MTPQPLQAAPATAPRAVPRQLSGCIVEVDGRGCLVSAEGHLHEAQRAPSCLIDLLPGDRVALWLDEDATLYVLAVLARSDAAAAEPLRISAPEGLSLDTGRLEVTADELRGRTRSLHWVSQFVHQVADSLHLLAERSFRHVRTIDQQRCGHLDIAADQLIHARAQHTLIASRQLSRVDGKQIQLG
jgi:hypothetical protein